MKCLKPPLVQEVTWDRTPLGLGTATPDQPRAALAVEGSERTLEPRNIGNINGKPALHREAERDTTGSLNRQHQIHTLIDRLMQGKRRATATLADIRARGLSLR